MKIVEINALTSGSTGNIMMNIARVARKRGHQVYTFSGARRKHNSALENHIRICHWTNYYIHYLAGKYLGLNEQLSIVPTLRLINSIKRIKPDIIHLHIVHGQYLNINLLFSYLCQSQIPVVWTFHDCWAFTGRCPHFQLYQCDKWKKGCENCIYPAQNYPASIWDNTKRNWKKKKRLFSNIDNLTIVTPSIWLAGLVRESFFGQKDIRVINNGIDLSVFKPMQTTTNKYQCCDKFVILGVASNWGKRKGFDVFLKLATDLDCNRYQIILVGTDDEVDKLLPQGIISIHRTENQNELAAIYSMADLFVNPTREDTFPTVNMEALACGTPVLTFATGGSPEILTDECGYSVLCDDYDNLLACIENCDRKTENIIKTCRQRALSFNKDDRFLEYLSLYAELYGRYNTKIE